MSTAVTHWIGEYGHLVIGVSLTILIAILCLGVWADRREKNGKWHPYAIPYRLRRWLNGEWQYRYMTREEIRYYEK